MTVESLDTLRAIPDAVAEVQNFDARQSHCGVSPVRPELQIHNDIVLCIEIPGNNADLNIIPRSPWLYIGAWERAPETGRLHFHGIFYIPEGAMSGKLEEVRDYDTRKKRIKF